jgi:hypothetical protein
MFMTEKKLNTVKPALVTTSIKQKLVLCDLNLYFPSVCFISIKPVLSNHLGSRPGRVKPKTIKLEFVASPLKLIGSESE